MGAALLPADMAAEALTGHAPAVLAPQPLALRLSLQSAGGSALYAYAHPLHGPPTPT